MVQILKTWYRRYFSDTEAVILAFMLLFGFLGIMFLGNMLAPVIASLVIAYLLEWVVKNFQDWGMSRGWAILFAYLGFVGLFLILLLVATPIVWHQFRAFFNDIPKFTTQIQDLLMLLPEKFPELISHGQIDDMVHGAAQDMRASGRAILSASLASIPGLVTALVYLILVPLLIFFFLKDKTQLQNWVSQFLPKERRLLRQVWYEVDDQIGNYVRGKVAEIIIVGGVTFAVFIFLKLQYAALLATLVGFSVLIPYIGAAVVTVPVVSVAYFQWGFNQEFATVTIAYLIIQALDGNVLVPLLFSEAVNLHPVAIIVAILFFGGIWGFWGVFFAIPLATLVKAVISAWPLGQEGAQASD